MEQPGSAAVSKRRRGTQLDVTTTLLVQKGKNTKQRQIVNFFCQDQETKQFDYRGLN